MYIGGVPGGTRLPDRQSGAAHSCSVTGSFLTGSFLTRVRDGNKLQPRVAEQQPHALS